MFDAGSPSDAAAAPPGTEAQPRAVGSASVGVRVKGGRSRLSTLAQSGSVKCLLPRVPGDPEAIFLNTAGGITGGDRLAFAAEAGEGARLTCATQTAERLYRAQPGTRGRVSVRLTLGAGSSLDWLAQETIAFDRAAVERSYEIDMAADARLLMVEPLVLGRAAMGETVRAAHIADRWRLRRAGRLVWADAFRLSGPVSEIAARPGLLAGNRAAASLLYAAPDAADRLAGVRALLPETAGASAFDGLVVVRILAPEGRALRKILHRLLPALRGAPLPRVWTM